MNGGELQLADFRERERAAHDWGGTYLVEAAAGTGKTTLLISRILTIVTETLTPLSHVAAITFTEKAAGELKTRLRKTLEENAGTEDEGGERCRTALHDLDLMPVSTIHAFSRELLQQRPVEAAVDPGFTVLDEAAAGMLREEVWQNWIASEFARDCPARALLERGFGIESRSRESSLRALFDLLISVREDADALHVPARSTSEAQRELAAFREDVMHALPLQNGCRAAGDKLLNFIRDVQRWTATRPDENPENELTWLCERPNVNRNHKGQKGNWDKDALEAARAFFIDSFEPRAELLVSELFSVFAAPVLEWLKQGVTAYEEAKAARGVLDFHDLLLRARNMLRHHADVREFFKDRYSYILVDEFQDTDPLQTEIVFFLAERKGRNAERWDDVELEDGKLFLVGDPKQSIYRFRRADLDLYGRVKDRISACGECLPIRVNFRSRPELIAEINALFAGWMTGATAERYEPEYVAMEPHRGEDASRPAALFLPPPAGFDLSQSSDLLAEAEAARIAEFICERTHPSADKQESACCFRDIGVLYAATTHLTALENALKSRGIPFRTAGGRNLPARGEIIALRAVLNAIDNPYDETSVVGALRSPFFGCSDEDLLAHRLSGARFNYLRSYSLGSPLHSCFAALRALHEIRRQCSPAEVLTELFSQTAGLQIFALKPQGETRVNNLLTVLDTARAFERSGGYSFHRLARWLDRLEEFRAGEEDYPGDDDDDAVQLSTFHKAKGLEFPVVILYRIAQSPERQTAGVVHDRAHKVVEFKSGSWETAGFRRVKEDEQDRQDYESRRLFYVACTRARDVLVIPAYWQSAGKRRESSRFTAMLEARYPAGSDGIPQIADSGFHLHPTEPLTLEAEPQEGLLLNMTETIEENAAQEARRERQNWEERRAAAVARLDHAREFIKPSEHSAPEAERETSALRRAPVSAANFGLFVHRLLQKADLPDGKNLAELAVSPFIEPGLSDTERSEGLQLAERALRSPLFQKRLAKAEKVFRELGFTAAVEGRIVEGALDLLFFENGQPVIVDFKTDRVSVEQIPARAESYRHQAAVYARAMEAVLNKPVREVILYFLRPGTIKAFTRDVLLPVDL